MYQITEINGVIAIPPEALGMGIEEILEKLVRERYECHMHRDKGFILLINDIQTVGEGIIAHGNSSVYQKVTFKALVFKPYLHEVVDGIVCKIVEFGTFCHIGPVDALAHVSQVMDDYVDVDQVNGRLVGKESKRVLSVGDTVRARIVALGVGDADPDDLKIGLTMRQLGLGKHEWIEEDINKANKKEK